MASFKRNEPLFHLQGGAVLGATVGLAVSTAGPRTATLLLIGAAALAFILWFRGSLWPLLSRTRFYESFFGIAGPGPLTYIKEGAAAGIVVGGAAGLVLSTSIASLLVWAGLGLLVIRYMDTLRCLLAALQGAGGGRHGSAYGRLLARLHGDQALAERLVTYEAKRKPTASREELAEQALARLERDSR